jgi:hypothetical protein
LGQPYGLNFLSKTAAIRRAKIIVFFINLSTQQQTIARSYDGSVIIFTIGFGKFYDKNLKK